jgi:signal transduction histidine kinase
MASMPDKSPATAPTGTSAKDGLPPTGTARVSAPSSAADVVRELEQLRDRFRKTTNALASAAHDLKTPLAILNGYIELLQSQRLGPLNDRQREVMGDMFSSGQRLQHFIQDFLRFAASGRAGFRSAVSPCTSWRMTN